MKDFEDEKKSIRYIVGANIKRLREALNMTKTQFAKYLSAITNKNITASSVIAWESGSYSPDISLLPFICQILDCELNDLMSNNYLTDKIENKMFGNILEKLRLKKGLSLNQLAKDLTMNPVLLALFENGMRSPTVATLIDIANYFDVSLDFLLGKEENEESKTQNQQENTIRIIGRGGVIKEYKVTEEQQKAFETLLATLPKDDPDLKF